MPAGGRPRRLRAGALETTFDGGGLRWISFGGTEVLRGILLTARDADWRTLVPDIQGLIVTVEPDSFSIAFDARFRGHRFDVDARVAYDGSQDGRIVARFEAQIGAESVVQRLGLIVLHPASVAGRRFETSGPSPPQRGAFPELVTADRFATGYRAMAWEPAGGLTASLAFEGDAWEMEDQRAWTDASYKSYSPPLSRPHPVTLVPGATLETSLQLTIQPAGASALTATVRRRRAEMRVTVRHDVVGPLPPIGLGWVRPLQAGEALLLRELGPAHLRVVLDQTRGDWRGELDEAARDAGAVGAPLQLELVAFATDGAREALAADVGELDVPVASVLAFGSEDDAGLVTTAASHVDALRTRLGDVLPGTEVGGGSRANYAELAATALPLDALDAVAFAVTPQIHAVDAATVLENVATLPVLVRSGAVLSGGRPLDVLGSFRPRFDVYADPPERRLADSRFDDRLGGALGSIWLIGTLAGLLSGAVGRVTILEAAGPAGVLEGGRLLELLSAIQAMRGGRVLGVEAPTECAALALRAEGRLRVLLANLRDRAASVDVALPAGWRLGDAATSARVDIAPSGFLVIDGVAT
jgi:hypothetical protein